MSIRREVSSFDEQLEPLMLEVYLDENSHLDWPAIHLARMEAILFDGASSLSVQTVSSRSNQTEIFCFAFLVDGNHHEAHCFKVAQMLFLHHV
jgi:hypothetical protein